MRAFTLSITDKRFSTERRPWPSLLAPDGVDAECLAFCGGVLHPFAVGLPDFAVLAAIHPNARIWTLYHTVLANGKDGVVLKHPMCL